MKKKISIRLFVFIILLSMHIGCAHRSNTANIFEGVGVENIMVGKSTKYDVVKRLGANFSTIVNKKYSIRIYYKELGLSFYYRFSDKKEKIFAILVEPPFKGESITGIVLSTSTMRNVVDAYGQGRWGTGKGTKTWYIEYPGIKFHVEKDTTLPEFPLNKKVHISKKITGITITQVYKNLNDLR